jgi:putative tryptophan/tyrosine transport system substrate-binding protein
MTRVERRGFIVGTLSLLAAPLAAEAQPAGKVHRIGFVTLASSEAIAPHVNAMRQGLRKLGHVDGQSVVIDVRAASGRADRMPELVAELINLKPDVLVTATTPAALVAKEATRTIPIVMTAVGDPVGVGIVSNLARPEANVTGLSLLNLAHIGKQLQLLKEAAPQVRRFSLLWNSVNPGNAAALTATQAAAAALGVDFQAVAIRGPDDLQSALATVITGRAGALLVAPDPVTYSLKSSIIRFAAANRLPVMYNFREEVEAGGLMAYGADLLEHYRRAATYVDKILKGAKPADLPVEQATKFDFFINIKTAKALGLTIPPAVLARADEVIE